MVQQSYPDTALVNSFTKSTSLGLFSLPQELHDLILENLNLASVQAVRLSSKELENRSNDYYGRVYLRDFDIKNEQTSFDFLKELSNSDWARHVRKLHFVGRRWLIHIPRYPPNRITGRAQLPPTSGDNLENVLSQALLKMRNCNEFEIYLRRAELSPTDPTTYLSHQALCTILFRILLTIRRPAKSLSFQYMYLPDNSTAIDPWEETDFAARWTELESLCVKSGVYSISEWELRLLQDVSRNGTPLLRTLELENTFGPWLIESQLTPWMMPLLHKAPVLAELYLQNIQISQSTLLQALNHVKHTLKKMTLKLVRLCEDDQPGELFIWLSESMLALEEVRLEILKLGLAYFVRFVFDKSKTAEFALANSLSDEDVDQILAGFHSDTPRQYQVCYVGPRLRHALLLIRAWYEPHQLNPPSQESHQLLRSVTRNRY